MDTTSSYKRLEKWKSHTKMAQPSEKFRWKKSMACPCFLHWVFSKAVQPSMKVVVEVYINDFFLAVEYANKMVRQIKEWCFFWSVSLQPTKRSTFPHAVLLRQERVACHCFMSFGLCNKNGTASCGYKSSRCQHGKQRKVLGCIVLKYFKAYRQGFFLPCHSRRKLVWSTRTVFLRRRLTFIQNTRKDENIQTK